MATEIYPSEVVAGDAPNEPTQPDESLQPYELTKPGEPDQPTGLAEPLQSGELLQPDERTQSARLFNLVSFGSGDSLQPGEFILHGELVKLDESTDESDEFTDESDEPIRHGERVELDKFTSGPDVVFRSDWGDTVGRFDEMWVEEDAERFYRYAKGKYYPLCLGEILNETFRVEHKLGHGRFSTVWMAHNMRDGTDVALKIMEPGDAGERELVVQDEIMKAARDTSYLLTYLETFMLEGQHAGVQHRVFVFPLAGPNLERVSKKPMKLRMAAAKRLLQAVKNLHESGIIHRDLSCWNVMLGMVSLENHSKADKYEILGRPLKYPLSQHIAWRPGELVKAMSVPDKVLENTAYLGDFGISIKPGTALERKIQSPNEFCAPERMHNMSPSFASDMWSYMALFLNLYVGHGCFSPEISDSAYLNSVVDAVGPLPEEWSGYFNCGGPNDSSWYDQSRETSPRFSLQTRIADKHSERSPREQELVLSILKRGFSYQPQDRLTAAQLLEDPSFKEFMSFYEDDEMGGTGCGKGRRPRW